MKNLFSHICLSCLAGLMVGIVLVSLTAIFIFDIPYTAQQLLGFYGLSMLAGIVIGAIAGWVKCYRCSHVHDKLPH